MKDSRKKEKLTPALASEWVDEELDRRIEKFLKTGHIQEVSFRDWCSRWDWAHRSDVFTHMIHPYPAKLLPYVPIVFLASSYLKNGDTVLDPFAGTGTVLLESLVNKFKSVNSWGVELNPLARLIAKVKTTPLSAERIEHLHRDIQRSAEKFRTRVTLPDFKNRDYWFRNKAQTELAQIRAAIEKLDADVKEKDFFLVSFSAIIRDMSRADPDIAPPVRFNPNNFPKKRIAEMKRFLERKRRANAWVLFSMTVNKNKERLRKLVDEIGLRPSVESDVIWDDARTILKGKYLGGGKISKIRAEGVENSVAMVITSPPYMAAQKYIRTTRLELCWLGLANDEQIKELDREIIGSERVSNEDLKELDDIGVVVADKLLKKVRDANPLRAAIAARYYRDMRDALHRIHTILKPQGTCVIVVGNNTVTGLIAPNHRILSEIAEKENKFRTRLIIKDPIRSRGMITKRHESGGVIADEYIIILQKC